MIKVEIEGLKVFRRELKKVDSEFGKAMRQTFLKVANLVGDKAKGAAPGRLRKSIKPRATQQAAFIGMTANPPDALARFWGAKRRTGWYTAYRYRNSRGKQFAPWVGNQWDPGETGGQPYYIGPAINSSVDEVLEIIGDDFEDLASQAFPS